MYRHPMPFFECTCGQAVRGHGARSSHRRRCHSGEWLPPLVAYDARVRRALELIIDTLEEQTGEPSARPVEHALL